MDASGYVKAVDTVLQEIGKGNVTRRTSASACPCRRGAAFELYGRLREHNPRFGAYLSLPEATILSSRPSVPASTRPGGSSRPIKGTRARGADPEEDDRLARTSRRA